MLPRQKADHIFSEQTIYPADLERDIGYKLKAPFAKLFHYKLMGGKSRDKIVLTRNEIRLMKQFFLLETMRIVSMKEIAGFERIISQKMATMYPNFKEKVIPGETVTERWRRNIRVIVENDDLMKVREHPLCIYEVLRWASIFISGYFAIWDCSDSDTDFLISDIGMTSEVEQVKLKDGYEHTKIDAIRELIDREKTSVKRSMPQWFSRMLNMYLFPKGLH